jgi:uncharacterized Zn finger protein
MGREGPRLDVLLELALAENRPADALHWYDRLNDARRTDPYSWGAGQYSTRVAEAVEETHPDRAIPVYLKAVADYIAQTSPSAYEQALPYLRKLRTILTRLGREEEWASYLTKLRETERRKRKLMEVLDRLDGKRIVDS